MSGRRCLGGNFCCKWNLYKGFFKDDSKEIQGCIAKGQ